MNPTLRLNLLLRIKQAGLPISWLLALLFSASVAEAQTVTTGKSYINISRPNGGTFLPGDVVEIRATIAVTNGTNTSTTRLNAVRYNDTINTAKLDYIPNSLKMISNEGRIQYTYTDAADADSANINTGTGQIRFNIGNNSGSADVSTQGEAVTNAGRLWGGNYMRPSFFGNTCIRVYAYQVRIKTLSTAVAVDTVVVLRAGNFRYQRGTTATDVLSGFPLYQVRITPDYGLCNNSIGTNAIVGESGGTFGSGTAQNKAGGSSFVPPPYTVVNFGAGTPNDNFYGLANRTSADGSTNPNSALPGATRVHSVWDIIGDHTGATNPVAGNPPTGTGYAVVINASYETNRAFTQTITNLCEETYYEFSAWFRNICRRCGCDSSGKGAGSTGFVPSPGNDSSGVRPNLTFQIDGQDLYTTGNLAYTGEWIKKGFIYRTRAGQTSFTVTIRNNAPGGGGNDWAIDDIGVATCLPTMQYSPSLTPKVCRGNSLTIYDTVRSFFPNYVYYRWQRSTDDGGTWSNVGPATGPVSNAWNGSAYEYVSAYTVPPANTLPADSGDKYRLLVATSMTNLGNQSCRSTDATNTVTLDVLVCDPVLDLQVVSLNAAVVAGRTQLKWVTRGIDAAGIFYIEKSDDGIHFNVVGEVPATESANSQYSFHDPEPLQGKSWYRLKAGNSGDARTYTRILEISSQEKQLRFTTVMNPFRQSLYFDITGSRRGRVTAMLLDAAGKPMRSETFNIQAGTNQLSFNNTGSLSAGIYILRVEQDGVVILSKVVKEN